MNQAIICQSLIWGFGQSFAKTATIEPVTLANLMVYLCHKAGYIG